MKKTTRFFIRCSEAEKAAAEKLAERHGVSISDLVRGYVRRKARQEKVWQGE